MSRSGEEQGGDTAGRLRAHRVDILVRLCRANQGLAYPPPPTPSAAADRFQLRCHQAAAEAPTRLHRGGGDRVTEPHLADFCFAQHLGGQGVGGLLASLLSPLCPGYGSKCGWAPVHEPCPCQGSLAPTHTVTSERQFPHL